jgi:hypothetical protein
VLRRLSPVIAPIAVAVCLLAGCGPDINTKEKVREDLLTHLQKAGLDTKALDIDITRLTFDKNKAQAAVSFRPKGVTSVHDGMTMNYTLESRDGHWVVIGRADSKGHGASQAPSGHGAPGGGNLPPGHPQIQPGESSPPAVVKPLPPGHPKVSFLLRQRAKFRGESGTQIGTGLSA